MHKRLYFVSHLTLRILVKIIDNEIFINTNTKSDEKDFLRKAHKQCILVSPLLVRIISRNFACTIYQDLRGNSQLRT